MSQIIETRKDQIDLLHNLLQTVNEDDRISVMYAAWASALTTGSSYVKDLVKTYIGTTKPLEMRDIEFAIARMGVTNPYYMARQFSPLAVDASLENLNFRSFDLLDVKNEIAYHHACVAISLINGGYICLRSHVSSLQSSGVSDEKIDITMRIAAVCHSLNIIER